MLETGHNFSTILIQNNERGTPMFAGPAAIIYFLRVSLYTDYHYNIFVVFVKL